ncbi:MAG: SH3 domain-containing protein [Chloroflexi bacterium]|nr:SH3 domain-containing protein [Chloroflexota bacterium]
MSKPYHLLVSVSLLVIAALACSQTTPGASPDPHAVNTSIAQTIAVRQTEAARANPATATFTAPASLTPSIEPTLSTTPTFTPTFEPARLTVSVDTNCRSGPGAIFERVGVLSVGETAEIVGREPKGEYWYIRNPGGNPEFCWVWGQYAAVSGNLLTLVYMTPPQPPESAFQAAFQKMESCDKTWWVEFTFKNSSGAAFESWSLTLNDAETSFVGSLNADNFTNRDGCDTVNTSEAAKPGETLTVSAPPFGYNPKGHSLTAQMTICTEDKLKGTCLTRELTFSP